MRLVIPRAGSLHWKINVIDALVSNEGGYNDYNYLGTEAQLYLSSDKAVMPVNQPFTVDDIPMFQLFDIENESAKPVPAFPVEVRMASDDSHIGWLDGVRPVMDRGWFQYKRLLISELLNDSVDQFYLHVYSNTGDDVVVSHYTNLTFDVNDPPYVTGGNNTAAFDGTTTYESSLGSASIVTDPVPSALSHFLLNTPGAVALTTDEIYILEGFVFMDAVNPVVDVGQCVGFIITEDFGDAQILGTKYYKQGRDSQGEWVHIYTIFRVKTVDSSALSLGTFLEPEPVTAGLDVQPLIPTDPIGGGTIYTDSWTLKKLVTTNNEARSETICTYAEANPNRSLAIKYYNLTSAFNMAECTSGDVVCNEYDYYNTIRLFDTRIRKSRYVELKEDSEMDNDGFSEPLFTNIQKRLVIEGAHLPFYLIEKIILACRHDRIIIFGGEYTGAGELPEPQWGELGLTANIEAEVVVRYYADGIKTKC